MTLHRVGRAALRLWGRVAEPRVLRVVQGVAYLVLLIHGLVFLFDLPPSYEGFLGTVTSTAFAGFLTGGGLLGLLGVLPGAWWLERLGIIALWVALSTYIVVVLTLGAGSVVALATPIVVFLMFVTRWLQERMRIMQEQLGEPRVQ
jgi:hypothetical protein